MRLALLLLLTGLALPARAFDIDFAAVVDRHADTVEDVAGNERRLRLPGPVVIMQTRASDGTISYSAFDESPAGAVGCLFDTMVDLSAAVAQCPALLNDAERTTFSTVLMRLAVFAATNTVPQVPAADLPERLAERLAARRDSAAGLSCPGDPEASAAQKAQLGEIRRFLSILTSPTIGQTLDEVLDIPRLPVRNPCF